jgi:lysophospholipase
MWKVTQGGTIGMKNSPGLIIADKEHGYIPIPGYLTKKLKENYRFHERDFEIPPMNLVMKSVPAEEEHSTVINGTPVISMELEALITPLSLYNKRTRYSILEYKPLLDSSNMSINYLMSNVRLGAHCNRY